MIRYFSILASLLIVIQTGFAQDEIIPIPQKSPFEKVVTQIGIIDVSIEYSRPSVQGRKIFGELVPYEKVWRTGANLNTRITFSGAVVIGDQELEEGAYSIFAIPRPNDWVVIFHSELNDYGAPDTILEKDVVARIIVPTKKSGRMIETFSINFEDIHNDGCNLVFAWEHVFVKVPLNVSTSAILNSSLEKTLVKTADAYAFAASNYLEIKQDAESALKAINFALALKEKDTSFLESLNKVDPKDWSAPWYYQLKSEIHAALGQYEEAINAAKRSLEICKKVDDAQYSVKRNTDNIEKWSS